MNYYQCLNVEADTDTDEEIDDMIEDNTTIIEKIKVGLQIALRIPHCQKCLSHTNRLVKCICKNEYCIECIKQDMLEDVIKTNRNYHYSDANLYRHHYKNTVKMPCGKDTMNLTEVLASGEMQDFNKLHMFCWICQKIFRKDSPILYGDDRNKTCKDCIIQMVKNGYCYNDGYPYEEYYIVRDKMHYGGWNDITLAPARDIISEELFNEYILNNIRLECSVCYTKCSQKTVNKCDCGNKVCDNCLISQLSNNYGVTFQDPDYETHSIDCLVPDCKSQIPTKSFIDEESFSDSVKQIILKPKYCVENNCNGLLNDGTCEKCHSVVCKKCHQRFHDGDCNEEDIEMLQKTAGYGGNYFRNCPRCDELIFKNEGCENMFCWNCSITFNWYDDYDYTSFDFSGYNFYKLYKKALKKGIEIRPNDFEDDGQFSISQLYNSEGELSPDSDEEEITRKFNNDGYEPSSKDEDDEDDDYY